MAVVAAREFGVLEEGSDPGTTGERMLSPEGIGAQFGQNRICAPARMGAAHLENGITERRCDRAERPTRWSTERRSQTCTTLALPNAAPLADSPDRAVERGRNHGIGLPSAGAFHNRYTFFKGGWVCTTCHDSPSFLPVNGYAGGMVLIRANEYNISRLWRRTPARDGETQQSIIDRCIS